MLAPIRYHFAPKEPKSSPLLCTARDQYFARLSAEVDPAKPGFEKTRWIVSEDVNVEHLLNIFSSINPDAENIREACGHFVAHLYRHKQRTTALGTKIEELSDGHPSKPKWLSELAEMFSLAGDHAERKSLLVRALALERKRENDSSIAKILKELAEANRWLSIHSEGIGQAEEASKIHERLGNKTEQANSLNTLACLLFEDDQLDDAENATLRAIELVPEKGQENDVCNSHRLLGQINRSKGEKAKAIHHFETAISIASPFKWRGELFWNHLNLAELFLEERKFDEANARVKQAKSHAVDDAYKLGCAMEIQAEIWSRQGKFKDAKLEIAGALEMLENLGGEQDLERCRDLLRKLNRR